MTRPPSVGALEQKARRPLRLGANLDSIVPYSVVCYVIVSQVQCSTHLISDVAERWLHQISQLQRDPERAERQIDYSVLDTSAQ